MSRRRAKTPGWAAFDPKKQQNHVNDNETHNDPFPPISTNISTTLNHCKNPSRNGDLIGKSFSSALAHSASEPSIIPSEDTTHSFLMENGQSEKMNFRYIENNVSQLYQKLKKLHPWANENLVEDIMAAVDNDIDKASTLLREMALPGSLQETEFEDNTEEGSLNIKNDEPLDGHNNSRKMILDHNAPLGFLMDMSMIPVEPEWEDDDMYLVHRKEAIRAMRLASRHSKAATEAYLRRDHAAAQEFSLKAREEWSNAEKLNAKAAKEILAIRNCENDDWKLDLHGLHSAEAVEVLVEHLLKIESQLLGTHSTKTNNFKEFASQETEKSDRQQLSRPRLLEVITGKGNHSRGEAALPVAIKSFLSEKGYHYYEARAGVITLQPKFRQLSTAVSNT